MLNKCLLQRTCTTEDPEDILYRSSGSKIFSEIDLKDAYLQIPRGSDSSELTGNNTPFRLYKYNFLPFGLSVSPAIFQHVMNNIIKGLTGVVVYQDDVIIHAVDKNSHDACLFAVFRHFRDHNVTVNLNKCMFDCLGYCCIFIPPSNVLSVKPNMKV